MKTPGPVANPFGRRRYTLILIGGGLLLLALIGFGLLMLLQGGGTSEAVQGVATATPAAPTSTPTALPQPVAEAPTSDASLTPTLALTAQPYQYTVQEGETLLYIIQLFGYRDASVVPEIIVLNGMASENDLRAGQVLLIPQQTPTPGAPLEIVSEAEAETAPGGECSPEQRCASADGQYWVHIVSEGDTIAGIAFAYESRIRDILEANGLPQDPIIGIDQQILVPILITLTPTLTPTGGPDSTATPTPTLSAPALFAPAVGERIPRGQAVTLQWLSAGPLEGSLRYVVEVRRTGDDSIVLRETTRANSLRLPQSLAPGGLEGAVEYAWRVSIVQGSSPESPVLGGTGETRTFTWGG